MKILRIIDQDLFALSMDVAVLVVRGKIIEERIPYLMHAPDTSTSVIYVHRRM
jgi:hypothetical protein